MLTVVNFAHPLTDEHRARIEELAGKPVGRVIDVRAHFDHAAPFAGQARALADAAGLTATEWQTLSPVVNPPAFAPAACAVVAELHGRIGHFPVLVRMRPVAGSSPPAFEPAELMNLQAARDAARGARA